MKWHRTDKGLKTEGYRIERILDKHIWTKETKVWGYRLIKESTNERLSFGTMREAKWWVENGWV